jgi:hypothetical protein
MNQVKRCVVPVKRCVMPVKRCVTNEHAWLLLYALRERERERQRQRQRDRETSMAGWLDGWMAGWHCGRMGAWGKGGEAEGLSAVEQRRQNGPPPRYI